MSTVPNCSNLTAPIDIRVSTPLDVCDVKCKLSYNFKALTDIVASNMSTYLKIVPANKAATTVGYSSTDTPNCKHGGDGKFVVSEIRIYTPSIHTYATQRDLSNGELIIFLNNITGGRNLLICIPISSSASSASLKSAGIQLETIITQMSSTGNTSGQSSQIKGLNFNLDKFMPPPGKGYYKYTASFFTLSPPCIKCLDYVVYDINDIAISLKTSSLAKLISILQTPPYLSTIQSPPLASIGYARNNKGATNGLTEDREQIYIDCKPTGSKGEVLIDESKNGILDNNPFSMISGPSPARYQQLMSFGIGMALTIGVILIVLLILLGLPRFISWAHSNYKTPKASSKAAPIAKVASTT
jgi:hypothetical protein